jgi:hypothetical protein
LARTYLCAAILGQGRLDDARAACAASVASIAKALGADSPALVWPLSMSGLVELKVPAPAAALPPLERAVAIARTAGARPIELHTAEAYLAIALRLTDREAEAVALARRVAPELATPELAQARLGFVQVFPELAKTAGAAP